MPIRLLRGEAVKRTSARTLNHYLQAMVSFLNWMERVGRIKGNPLKFVGKIDERGQSKRVRRALPMTNCGAWSRVPVFAGLFISWLRARDCDKRSFDN